MHKPPRWPTHMGRWSVHPTVFNAAPQWMHDAADWAGGVEPSPWTSRRFWCGFLTGFAAFPLVLAAVHWAGVRVLRARNPEGGGS